MKYNYCIWDFNGTILDDIELGINSVNTLLKEQQLPIISSREEYRKHFDFPIVDYYRKLGFDFDKIPYDVLARQWVALYLKNLEMAKLFDGVGQALDFFDSKGLRQTVISASERSMLLKQLEGLGIAYRFEEILGIDNIYGDSKLMIASDWCARHPEARALFIGDTVHDIKTAKILGADCFIVTSGHQSKEKFVGADAKVFSNLGELLEHLQKIL